ncbi:head protein, partial [Salmonella enterica]|nr:head protein [Salmonella enterica]
MLVDGKNLKVLEVNIKSTFQNAFKAAKPVYSRLATEVP